MMLMMIFHLRLSVAFCFFSTHLVNVPDRAHIVLEFAKRSCYAIVTNNYMRKKKDQAIRFQERCIIFYSVYNTITFQFIENLCCLYSLPFNSSNNYNNNEEKEEEEEKRKPRKETYSK